MKQRFDCHSVQASSRVSRFTATRERIAPFSIGAARRGIPLVLQSLLIAFLLMITFVTPASADPGLPGHWHGTPDPDACNTFNDCIYIFDICYNGQSQTLGSHDPRKIQHDVLVDMIGAAYGDCPPPPLTHSERCKLVDIDSPIIMGLDHLFTAHWLGNIDTLQFKGENGQANISPIGAGFADGARSGIFTIMDSAGLPLLPPGQYQVSCIGTEGSVGDSISVTVTR